MLHLEKDQVICWTKTEEKRRDIKKNGPQRLSFARFFFFQFGTRRRTCYGIKDVNFFQFFHGAVRTFEGDSQTTDKSVDSQKIWLRSGLPDFSLFSFAQGLAPSMVRASDLRNRGWKLLPVFLVGRRRASLQRRFVDYGQTG